MEAARIPWRPLGRILVDQGLLTSEELETALEQQERTGKRLGETIVECGFVSGPELSNALASQYGIELTTETGFGTGLRGQIQRRHETERRGSRPTLVEVHPPEASAEDPESDEADDHSPDASLLTQLEEQWAKLAAAEALIAEHEQEFGALAAQRDRRREQAARLARRARSRSVPPESDSDESGQLHDRLAVAEASLRDRDGELGEARGALASAQSALGAQDTRIEELAAEFERVVQSRTEIEVALGEAQRTLSERERDVEELHHELGRRRAQAGRFATALRRHRLDAHETQRREQDFARTRAELEQAHEALAGADFAREEQERRLEELGTELERVVQSRTEVETALADARATLEEREHTLGELRQRLEQGHEAELAPLRAELEHAHHSLAAAAAAREELERELHARTEVESALADVRAALEERDHTLDELHEQLEQAHEAIAAADTARTEQERRLEELGIELERVVHSRTEVETALADARATLEERERALVELREQLNHGHEAEVAQIRHELDQAREAIAAARADADERATAHSELVGTLEHRRAQAVRLTRRLRSLRQVDEQQLSQIERLVADVRGCDVEIARLRQENERARAQTKRFLERLRRERDRAELYEPEPTPESSSHLVFVELPDRYALVERAGPPPPRNTPLELPELDRRLFVSGARRSPLPGDARPCVVARQRPALPRAS